MYQLPKFSKLKGVSHFTSTREYGNQAFSILGVPQPADEVVENRKRFLGQLGLRIESGVGMHVGDPKIVKLDRSFARDFRHLKRL